MGERSSRDGGGESFADLLEASMEGRQLVPIGEKVEGKVVSIGKEYVFLDLGTRTDGLLPLAEVTVDGEVRLAKGDRVTVLTTALKDGAVLCALRLGAGAGHEQASDKNAALEALQEAREARMPVEGTVKEVIKGGFSITVMGLRAFCPISQIQKDYCDTPEEHVGRVYPFEIIELDPSGRNIVVSRRKLLEAEAAELAEQLFETVEEGAVLTGTVTSIRSYGAFVDVGGAEGLLHVSEIAHERVSDPKDLLSPGQSVEVYVKEVDRQKKRLSLSLKALAEDPWLVALGRISEGQVIKGRVQRIARFGAFVELEKGVEGLVHISELGGDRHIATPREVVREGQELEVTVLSVDPDRRRIALGIAGADDDGASPEDMAAERSKGQASNLGTFGDLFASALKKK